MEIFLYFIFLSKVTNDYLFFKKSKYISLLFVKCWALLFIDSQYQVYDLPIKHAQMFD